MSFRGIAASDPTEQPPSAIPVPRHATSTTDHESAQSGPLVTIHVRAVVPNKVKLSDPAQGTVRATVLARDRDRNNITVQTQEGQRLVLYLTPASLAGLRVGAPCLLQVAQHAPQAPTRPPEREEVFW
jgi:hypothetical protein